MGNDKSNSDINYDTECYIVKKKPKDGESPEYYKDENDWIENGGKYFDPDSKDSKSIEFYKNLTLFLTAQEEEFTKKNRLERKYSYEFNEIMPYGIEVREENNGIKGGPIFYLKSDQFGFSAPDFDSKERPYDTYLRLNKGSDDAKEAVRRWLYRTRRLGGSFLWPMEYDGKGGYIENPQYNSDRGGTKNSANSKRYYHTYYIEDRVDLTLLEIKQVMDYIGLDHSELEGNILWKCCLPENNMVKWLRHFGNFQTYVEFFKFNDFVGENHVPIDITTNKLIGEDKTKTYIGEKRSRTIWTGENEGMDVKGLEKMFDNLSKKIADRSHEMKKDIKKYFEQR